jgi:holliday junction DNA helicase RuvB
MDRIVSLQNNGEEEEKTEKSLRPQLFSEVIGRKNEVENLQIMIEACKKRQEPLDHVMFYGPPGLGKTSFAYVIANEMGVPIHVTSGPAIQRQGDLASILTSIEENGILFIDEIHRLNKTVEEILYPAMEDKAIDIIIGKGPSAKTLRLELTNFTLIGATTRAGRLSAPLRDRFGAAFRFDFYSFSEIAQIIKQKANILGVYIEEEACVEIAKRSRKTPRIAIRILKRIRDFADVNNDGKISMNEVEQGLATMEIDDMGLDYLDRKILSNIVDYYAGGPVGVSTIAASISEEVETIEDVCEPYLLQIGFLKRTPRGRVVTLKAHKHLAKISTKRV